MNVPNSRERAICPSSRAFSRRLGEAASDFSRSLSSAMLCGVVAARGFSDYELPAEILGGPGVWRSPKKRGESGAIPGCVTAPAARPCPDARRHAPACPVSAPPKRPRAVAAHLPARPGSARSPDQYARRPSVPPLNKGELKCR
ncbi:hypothetical protein G6F31_016647 [Rhizopus arrhizus]|nr:hypothetical protein G6F31_016647 [Rhizopus arrhizus]